MRLQANDVEREAINVAHKNFGASNVVRAMAAPTVDLDGDDAWEVTIVLADDTDVDAISGDAVLDNLVEIHERLREKNDDRLPIVRFATERELREIDDPESRTFVRPSPAARQRGRFAEAASGRSAACDIQCVFRCL